MLQLYNAIYYQQRAMLNRAKSNEQVTCTSFISVVQELLSLLLFFLFSSFFNNNMLQLYNAIHYQQRAMVNCAKGNDYMTCTNFRSVIKQNWLQIDKAKYTLSLANIRKTRPCNEYPLKPHFYIVKLGYAGVYLFFLFLLQNIDCGYSLEPPRRGGSNVYPQSMF